MDIQHFFDTTTNTFSYIVSDPTTKKAAIIDSVIEFDPDSGAVTTVGADKIVAYVTEKGFDVEWILETHIHADHLTAAQYLQKKLGGKIGIGHKIYQVIELWTPIFDLADDMPSHPFDATFSEGDEFHIGSLTGKVFYTPGHTPACSSYLIGDCLFVGDTLFSPKRGTARADFPGGDARTLYRSIHKLFELPDETRVFLCHDYPPEGEELVFETTIGDEKRKNIMVGGGIDEDSYVQKRETRDKTLPVPKLVLPSIQHNMRAGSFGRKHENGLQYIHVPINAFDYFSKQVDS